MKTINVTKLKAHLSACLRLASSGEQIIVLDRREPLAQILPLDERARSSWEALSRAGLIRPGTQDWETLRVEPLRRKVPTQRLLADVRDER